MAAVGNVTKHGFLVREGDALERLAQVKHIAFDKTGTLTYGQPEVVAIESFGDHWQSEDLYRYVVSAELRSEHPLGKAIVKGYRKTFEKAAAQPEDFKMLPGRGIAATIEGHAILAGNAALLSEHGVTLSSAGEKSTEVYLEKGCTLTYLAVDGEAAGFVALSDTLREDAPQMIRQLKDCGVTPILLTGDRTEAAHYMAGTLGIDAVRANCLPEDKLTEIEERQQKGEAVCMIGDGINDAPALKKATVGIAMGGVGSDIAVDAADIALVDDKVGELPHLFRLAKRMMVTIKCNITFSLTLNFIAIILAITGILNPVIGALVHNAGSVLVIINSALLTGWKYRG